MRVDPGHDLTLSDTEYSPVPHRVEAFPDDVDAVDAAPCAEADVRELAPIAFGILDPIEFHARPRFPRGARRTDGASREIQAGVCSAAPAAAFQIKKL
jgi:hypothetical protein